MGAKKYPVPVVVKVKGKKFFKIWPAFSDEKTRKCCDGPLLLDDMTLKADKFKVGQKIIIRQG
jgi:hypothetical protein